MAVKLDELILEMLIYAVINGQKIDDGRRTIGDPNFSRAIAQVS